MKTSNLIVLVLLYLVISLLYDENAISMCSCRKYEEIENDLYFAQEIQTQKKINRGLHSL